MRTRNIGSLKQIRGNAGAADWQLSAEELRDVDAILKN